MDLSCHFICSSVHFQTIPFTSRWISFIARGWFILKIGCLKQKLWHQLKSQPAWKKNHLCIKSECTMYRQTTQTETKHCKTPQFGRLSLQNCDALCKSKHVQMFSDNSRCFKTIFFLVLQLIQFRCIPGRLYCFENTIKRKNFWLRAFGRYVHKPLTNLEKSLAQFGAAVCTHLRADTPLFWRTSFALQKRGCVWDLYDQKSNSDRNPVILHLQKAENAVGFELQFTFKS